MTYAVVGATGTHFATVSDDDTAIRMGSGDVAVLATPRVVAWLEAAALAAVEELTGDTTSVGIHISVNHRSPSPVGAEVRAVAEVRTVADKRIGFELRAFEGDRIIADGTHTRVIVDREQFLQRVGQRR